MHLIKNVEIFKTGELVSANGQPDVYSLADLVEIASTYNPQIHEGPVVISHNNDRNWARLLTSKSQLSNGWVKVLRVKDNSLFADIEVDDFTFKAIQEDKLKKRSIGLYPKNSKHNPTPGKYYLRHVALLGIEAPAVKGLQDIKIYSENNNMEETNLLNEKAAEWLAAALIDEGNGFNGEIIEIQPMPAEENNWLYDTEAEEFKGQFIDTEERTFDFTLAKTENGWSSAIKMANPEEIEDSLADEETVDEETVVEAAEDPRDNQIKMLQDELAKLQQESKKAQEASVKEFCDSHYEQGYLTLEQKDFFYKIMMTLYQSAPTLAYSEDNSAEPIVNYVKALAKSLPKQLNFSETIIARSKKETKQYASPYINGTDESNKEYSEIKAFMDEKNIMNFAEGYRQYKQYKNK